MTLLDVRDALLTVTAAVYHYEAPEDIAESYIVWAEDGQADAKWADDVLQDQVLQGTIDLYTLIEFDPMFDEVQKALNEREISFELNSIQREAETGYIHYEWVFEVG